MEEANRLVVESREKIEQQNQQLSDYEAEINLLRRRLETLESDREKDRKQIATLQDALNRARIVSTLTLRRPTACMSVRVSVCVSWPSAMRPLAAINVATGSPPPSCITTPLQ